MEISVSFSMLGRMFMFPASVVDEYLKISSGDHVKALLCIYCLGRETVSTEEVSRLSGLSEQTVKEAVIHFTKLGVIGSGLCAVQQVQKEDISLSPPASPPEERKAPESVSELKLIGGAEAIEGSKRKLSQMSRVRYTPKEIAAKIESSEELKHLRDKMEEIIAKPLTHSNVGDIIEMYEHLELSAPSIIMIAEYCKGLDKRQTAYILRVAQDWFNEGITEFDQIERKIINMGRFNSFEAMVKRVIGLNTNPSSKQRELIRKWQETGVTEELLRAAYDSNIEHTGKVNFKYIDKILRDWEAKGIKTLADVSAENEKFKTGSVSSQSGGISAEEYQKYAESIDFSKIEV